MAGTQLNSANTDYHRFDEQASDPSAPAAGFWHAYFKALGLFLQAPGSATAYFVGGARREIMVYAKDMWPATTAGCAALAQVESATNDVNYKTLDFDATSQEYANFSLIMPTTWVTSGDLTFQVYWMAAGGSVSETVQWELSARSYGDGISFDGAWSTPVAVSDTLIGTDLIHISAESTDMTPASTLSSPRLIQFRISRNPADNLAADAKLLAIRLFHF